MFNFKQKDDEFFDLFLESAKFFHAGALILDEVIQDYKTTAVKVEEINKIEHEADAINDRIIDKLNLTFITPIDREDIYALVSFLGNIRKNQVGILDASHKIERFESEGDLIYRREVAYLFENEKDPIELIRWKDVLEQLEDTLDHCEHIADMLRGVVMKYA